MPLIVHCLNCEKKFSPSPNSAKHFSVCPSCKHLNTLPIFNELDSFQVKCIGCQATLKAPNKKLRETLHCPSCKKMFKVAQIQILSHAEAYKIVELPPFPESTVKTPPPLPVRKKLNIQKEIFNSPDSESYGEVFKKIKEVFWTILALIGFGFLIASKLGFIQPDEKPITRIQSIPTTNDNSRRPETNNDDFILAPLVFIPQQAKRDYTYIDFHAFKTPANAEASIYQLADYLKFGMKDDHSKARAAFRWIVEKITYDTAGLAESKINPLAKLDTSPENVLKIRKTICAGYSKLFCELGKAMDLECRYVRGYARKPDLKLPKNPNDDEGHAWNAVKLDGVWHLLDCTWGDKSTDVKTEKENKVDEFYFLTPPSQMIFNHFPEQPAWQLLEKANSWEEFSSWPFVEVDLIKKGFSELEIRKSFRIPNFDMVKDFSNDGKVRVVAAPLNKNLSSNVPYRFVYSCAPGNKIFLAIEGSKNPWIYFNYDRGKNQWYLNHAPSRGTLEICTITNNSMKGQVVFEYSVK